MKRATPIMLVVMLAAAAAALQAAPSATMILRSGERIRCQLVDLGSLGFTVRSGGEQQTVPAGDVALIDFTGSSVPRVEVQKMQAGRSFIVLRSGDIVYGRLIDIAGVNPLRLAVRTLDGIQDFRSNEVARVFLARWNGM